MTNRVEFKTRLWHTVVCFVLAISIVIGTYSIVDAVKYPCKTYKNVSYGAHDMDVYIPNDVTNKTDAGAVLFIYETGWSSGLKSQVEYPAKEIASKGYITASMDVTHVGNGGNVWQNLQEITAAITKLKEFAADKGIQLSKIALHGTSSGAHLAMLYAWSCPQDSPVEISFAVNLSGATDFHSDTWKEWNYDEWYGPTLACALQGAEQFEEYRNADGKIAAKDIPGDVLEQAINAVSPLYYLNENSVPIICGYASDGKDGIFPTKNKTLLYEELSRLNVRYDAYEFPQSTHSLSSDAKIKTELYDKVIEYCKTFFGY